MDCTILKIISVYPDFVPHEAAAISALKYVKTRFHRDKEIRNRLTEEIDYIDQGHNISEPRCPKCEEELDILWFAYTMDEAFADNYKNLLYTSPCCSQEISLNELIWDFPCGFGKYSLEIRHAERLLSAKEISVLEAKLGTELKTIIARV